MWETYMVNLFFNFQLNFTDINLKKCTFTSGLTMIAAQSIKFTDILFLVKWVKSVEKSDKSSVKLSSIQWSAWINKCHSHLPSLNQSFHVLNLWELNFTKLNLISFSLCVLYSTTIKSQIQLYGFNRELYHNMSEAQHKAQGVVGIALMIQIGDTLNSDLQLFTTALNKVTYKGEKNFFLR